jgi:hypothetical protein
MDKGREGGREGGRVGGRETEGGTERRRLNYIIHLNGETRFRLKTLKGTPKRGSPVKRAAPNGLVTLKPKWDLRLVLPDIAYFQEKKKRESRKKLSHLRVRN